jgi:hypothetical protein
VTVKDASAGNLAVRVDGASVPLSPQSFALVITGQHEVVHAGEIEGCTVASASCPGYCSGHGTCSNSRCKCNVFYSGVDCSIENMKLACNEGTKYELTAESWSYIVLDLPSDQSIKSSSSWEARFQMYIGAINVLVGFNSQPSDSDHQHLGVVVQTEYENGTEYLVVSCNESCVGNAAAISNGSWVLGISDLSSVPHYGYSNFHVHLKCSSTLEPNGPTSCPAPPKGPREVCSVQTLTRATPALNVDVGNVSALSSIKIWRNGKSPLITVCITSR